MRFPQFRLYFRYISGLNVGLFVSEGGTTDDSPPCKRGEYSLANATREHGYLSGFYGKWQSVHKHPAAACDV